MKDSETLQSYVVEELAWDPTIDSSNIAVTARDGIVTLAGSVESFSQKLEAERAAKRIAGVRAVVDNMEVRLPPAGVRDDTAIADAAVRALSWHVAIPEAAINVVVERSWVKLTGEVEFDFQRRAAESAVRHLAGVKGVTNLITVKQQATPVQVKELIEAAFRRSAEIDAASVRVDVADGRITLSGTVRTWAEHEEAERAAWSAPGCKEVINELKVAHSFATAL
jgi:osmotically-inducible protein OsmY